MNYNAESLKLHKKYRGKITVTNKFVVKDKKALSLAYTPGVAQPCREIAKKKSAIDLYTNRKNQIAVITDGSAVLGLGNIGPEAGLPVMEGKCMLFKQFADIDAFPICLDTQKTDEIIFIIKNIVPVFAGINLEDIAAPRCFEIEEKLKQELNIPVFHDDQHGTAIVVLAGLINAGRALKKDIKQLKIVINGAGAAGLAVFDLLYYYGIKDIHVVDTTSSLYLCRSNIDGKKKEVAQKINYLCKENDRYIPYNKMCESCKQGALADTIKETDVFIGVSKPNTLTMEMIKTMNPDPIIFAMANPEPEINPNKAKKAGAKIVATGRSDYNNQINNVMAFPGLFRAVIDLGITDISEKIQIATAHAIAYTIAKPTTENLMPSLFDKRLVKNIFKEIKKSA